MFLLGWALVVIGLGTGWTWWRGAALTKEYWVAGGRSPGWWNNPAVLAALAAVSGALILAVSQTEPGVLSAVVCAALAPVLIVTDAGVHRLPNRAMALLWAGVAVALLTQSWWTQDLMAFGRAVGCGLVGGVIFGAMNILGGGIGRADVKLIVPLAAFTGWLSWQAAGLGLMISWFLAGTFALVLLLSRKANWRSHIAFGPWLVTGFLVSWALSVS